MQKIHFQNEDVRPSHVMELHKIPYTRETWHAKLKNTLAGLAQSKNKQPQHFCTLSLVLHCRGQVLTPGLLSLSVLCPLHQGQCESQISCATSIIYSTMCD